MDVGKMQSKLAQWSQDQDFGFDDIHNLVCRPEFLSMAWSKVSANDGSATSGVKGVTAKIYQKQGLKSNLQDLHDRLKSGTYEPEPVRRTYIPKGPDSVRPLGIPTIEDRIVQESLRLVLEPIYESDFSDDSFGFRPNRSCHDAIRYVSDELDPASGRYKHWVLDLDVKGYFDNVDHRHLMYALQNRIKDRDVQDLIWSFLKAGVKENGSVCVTGKGTPQGGIVSPLLANVYLHQLDKWIQNWTDGPRGGQENWTYVRYADDFLILTNGHKGKAEAMWEEVREFLNGELHLELSQEKSALRHAQADGLSFLGYDMQADSCSGGCKMRVPKEAKQYIRSRIREATEGDTNVSVKLQIKSLSRVVWGWANYYKYCSDAGPVFNDVGNFLWHHVMDWLAEKFECSRKQVIQQKLINHSPITYRYGDPEFFKSVDRSEWKTVQLFDPNGMSTRRTKSPRRHGHPYLSNNEIEVPGSKWGVDYREGHPGHDPYLAGAEDRTGSADQIEKARVRDNDKCQAVGCKTRGEDFTVVHHIRRRKSEDDDRLENLIVLCERHHHKIHHTGLPVEAWHEGYGETIMLT